MRMIKSGIAIAAMALLAPLAQASTFTNGGFEDSSFSGTFKTYGEGTNLGAWSVVSGSVDLINNYWTPSEGHYSLDLNGTSAGSIEQTFSTVAGRVYTVTFDMAGNTDGGGKVKTIFAGDADNTNTFTFNTTGHSKGAMGWETKSFSFTAVDSTSTLSFSGFAGNKAYGAAIDNITVSSVPEPETYGMLLAGLGLLGMIARRKKAAK